MSRSLIYDWCGDGLPHYRFGSRKRRGRIFIDPDDLDRWVAAMRVEEDVTSLRSITYCGPSPS